VVAAVAAIVLRLPARWWPSLARPGEVLGSVLCVGAAFVLGAHLLDVDPHWPPAEDQDRFLLILLPSVVLVESLAMMLRDRWRAVWLLRLIVAAGTARVLLHDTTYLTD